jgi:hypothetical protein
VNKEYKDKGDKWEIITKRRRRGLWTSTLTAGKYNHVVLVVYKAPSLQYARHAAFGAGYVLGIIKSEIVERNGEYILTPDV